MQKAINDNQKSKCQNEKCMGTYSNGWAFLSWVFCFTDYANPFITKNADKRTKSYTETYVCIERQRLNILFNIWQTKNTHYYLSLKGLQYLFLPYIFLELGVLYNVRVGIINIFIPPPFSNSMMTTESKKMQRRYTFSIYRLIGYHHYLCIHVIPLYTMSFPCQEQ